MSEKKPESEAIAVLDMDRMSDLALRKMAEKQRLTEADRLEIKILFGVINGEIEIVDDVETKDGESQITGPVFFRLAIKYNKFFENLGISKAFRRGMKSENAYEKLITSISKVNFDDEKIPLSVKVKALDVFAKIVDKTDQRVKIDQMIIDNRKEADNKVENIANIIMQDPAMIKRLEAMEGEEITDIPEKSENNGEDNGNDQTEIGFEAEETPA